MPAREAPLGTSGLNREGFPATALERDGALNAIRIKDAKLPYIIR
jgi:hypothetical protein